MNRLANEKSPYLLQHQNNPVDWFPWGEEAFAVARGLDLPIFLSIGYSTCYWCHVMEKESFERDDVAAAFRDRFVCIKVDREERPDVDSLYMNAVVSMTGRGGWPLSVFLTPDRKPFFGGTYFPRESFLQLLDRVHEIWVTRREELNTSADQLAKLVTGELSPREEDLEGRGLEHSLFVNAFHQFSRNFDEENGGFGGAPKFPPHQILPFLLRLHRRTGDPRPLSMVTTTLERMASGGIYDHLGFGFHRYSVDAEWLVPHFEKMLYDNAQLATTYLEAFQATGNDLFARVGHEILEYVMRDMMSPEGGCYAAEDAGEVGEEGAFYVWKEDELKQLLDEEEFSSFSALYGVTGEGNFEGGRNVLSLFESSLWALKGEPRIVAATEKLRAARDARVRPHRDEKILAGWNGLMMTGFCRGYQVLGYEPYLGAAQSVAHCILSRLFRGEVLFRRLAGGSVDVRGVLDDYAFVIQGLIDLYQSDFDARWLAWADRLQGILDTLFWSSEEGIYLYTDGTDPTLLVREAKIMDHAEPAGNGVAARNLLRLSRLLQKSGYRERAAQILNRTLPVMRRYPSALGSLLCAADDLLDRSTEVVIVSLPGQLAAASLNAFRRIYAPNAVLAISDGADEEGYVPCVRGKAAPERGSLFYVCEYGACHAPTGSVESAIEEVQRTARFLLD